jgi:hypothetical protein
MRNAQIHPQMWRLRRINGGKLRLRHRQNRGNYGGNLNPSSESGLIGLSEFAGPLLSESASPEYVILCATVNKKGIDMKVRMCFVGSSISSIGFRLITAIARREYPDTAIHFAITNNTLGMLEILSVAKDESKFSTKTAENIAGGLADADVVGFSSFSGHASHTKQVIAALRLLNPRVFVVWGGAHPTAAPDDALEVADAVCIGEGERAFPELLRRMDAGQALDGIGSLWFNRDGKIVRSVMAKLLTSEELNQLPHPTYCQNEFIHDGGRAGFRPMTATDYIRFTALSHITVFSRGCPFHCSYCGNDHMLAIDRDYGHLRHPSVDHIIEEILDVRSRLPFITVISFHDDCMIALV